MARNPVSRAVRMAFGVLVCAVPLLVVLVEVHPSALAGCATYGGYGGGCVETTCFELGVTTNQGYSWQKDSAWIYGYPGTEIDIFVRATLTLNTNQVMGWSMGINSDAPTLDPGTNGGDFFVNAAVTAPNVQADFENTTPWTCGVTQGVVLDFYGQSLLGPVSDYQAAWICYRVKFPTNDYSVHTVTVNFGEYAGVPRASNIVTRVNGETMEPCRRDLTLYVQSTYSSPTPTSCPASPMTPAVCTFSAAITSASFCQSFKRADANSDGTINLSDPVFILNYLFTGGDDPTCEKTMDANDDAEVNLTDAVVVLGHLFLGGAAPPAAPFPDCGFDPTPDSLTCASYNAVCPSSPPSPPSDPVFVELTDTTAISFTSERMASKEVQLADFDCDGDLDAFVPQSRGGHCQPDHVYVNDGTQIVPTPLVFDPAEDDHDGTGNGLWPCFPPPCDPIATGLTPEQCNDCGDTPPEECAPSFCPSDQVCFQETSYASIVVDIGSPGGGGPDGLLDVITVNGNDFMRVLINKGGSLSGTTFVDEGGRLVLGGEFGGWIPDENDSATSRIYHKESITVQLGPVNPFDSEPEIVTSLDDIAAGDFDQDGDLDLVVANRGQFAGGQVPSFFFWNDGTGKFEDIQDTGDLGVESLSIHDVAVGDLDGDGDLDVVFADDLSPPVLLINKDPDGTSLVEKFENQSALFQTHPSKSVRENVHVELCDLDNDGDLDVHLGNNKPNDNIPPKVLNVILWNLGPDGNGNPQFSPPLELDGILTYSAAYGDLDDDGYLDIVSVGLAEPAQVLMNREDVGGRQFVPLIDPFTAQDEALGVACGDLDGDGIDDIVITQGDGGRRRPNRLFLSKPGQ